jgi:hypothetical protein
MDKETPVRDSQTKAIELEDRLIDFAVRIIRLTAHLPQTPAGKHNCRTNPPMSSFIVHLLLKNCLWQ